MSEITEKEKHFLIQFRQNLTDLNLTGEFNSDWFLVKWLRARDSNLGQAETMLRTSLAWRKESDVDNILTWTPPKHIVEEYPWAILGADKEGCPVFTLPYGIWDVRKAVESGDRAEYFKYIDYICEYLLETMRKNSVEYGKTVTQFVGIYDMAHLSFRQLGSVATVDAVLESVRRFELNYPESLKTFYVINASRIFTTMYNLAKPFLSERTVKKFRILSSEPLKWKTVLLKNIPADQLPSYFGGNSSFQLKWYESENERGRLRNRTCSSESTTGNDYVALTVHAGEKLNVEHFVKYPDTTMSWSFKTDENDIGFSLLYENKDHEVVAYKRVNSHVTTQDGSTLCVKPGTYILCFDNTYSRMRSKTLYYNVHTYSPQDDESEKIPI